MASVLFVLYHLLLLLHLSIFPVQSLYGDFGLILPNVYSSFIAAANAVEITPLSFSKPFTLLAPLNSAFSKIPCFDPETNKTATAAIIKYHFINDPHDYNDLLNIAIDKNPWTPRTAYNDYKLNITMDNYVPKINKASWVVVPNVVNDPTVAIHGLDSVLVPPRVKVPTIC